MSTLAQACDAVLERVTTGAERVPGVVAMVTNETENIYEGAAGVRRWGSDDPMTEDTVFAILSTSKAVGGTAVLQCVEEGLLDFDAPAKSYAPEIGDLQVWKALTRTGTRNCVHPGAISQRAC